MPWLTLSLLVIAAICVCAIWLVRGSEERPDEISDDFEDVFQGRR
jgi:hypothetical protein